MKELLAAGPLKLHAHHRQLRQPDALGRRGPPLRRRRPDRHERPDRDGRRAHRLRTRRARRARRRVRQRRLDGDRPRRVQAAARQGDPDRRLRRRGGRSDRLARLRRATATLHAAERARFVGEWQMDMVGTPYAPAKLWALTPDGRSNFVVDEAYKRGRPLRLLRAAELQARPVRPPGVLRRRDPVGAVHLARLQQPASRRPRARASRAARTRPSPSTTARPTA